MSASLERGKGVPQQPRRGEQGGNPHQRRRGRSASSSSPFVRNKILVYFALLSDAGLDALLSFSPH